MLDYQNHSGVNMPKTKTIMQRQKLKSTAFYTESEVKIANLKSILAVTADVKVNSTECVLGEVRVAGKINYSIIYLDDDGMIDSALTSKDFLEKILDKDITPLSNVLIEAIREDTEWTQGDTIRLRTAIDLKGMIVASIDIDTIEDTECLKCYKEDVFIETSAIIPSTTKDVSKDVEIVGGIDRVMATESKVIIKSTATANQIVYVEGELFASLIYVQDNKLFNENITIPFNTEMSSLDIKDDSIVSVYGDVVYTNTVLEGTTGVLVESTISLKGVANNLEGVTLVKDAYSVDKEIKCEKTDYLINYTCCKETLTDKLVGEVRLDGVSARAIACTTMPTISGLNVAVVDGELVAEGVVNTRVIYLDDQGAPYTALVELPFQTRSGYSCSMAKVLCFKGDILSSTARIRMSDEIEFSASITISVEGQQDTTISSITSCEVLGNVEDDEATISLYIVGENETLFSVAKALRVDEERILRENPDLQTPLAEGAQIIIYKEL